MRPLPWLLATGALALAAACTGSSAREPAAGRERLTVGVPRLRIGLPVFTAARQGIFARHGLDVDLRVYETAQPMMEEVADGRIDAGGFVAYPIVLLAARDARQPPVVVGSLVEDADHRLSYALARPGSGLRFPAGVRGKKIGILPTAAYQRWLDAILKSVGIAAGEVQVVPLAPPLQAQSLAAGGVDLLFTGDPMATAMLAAGVAELVDDGPPCARHLEAPFRFGTFALSGKLARERPAAAARLVAALDEAIAEVRRDPAAARAALADHLRPEERAQAARYPDARYLTSTETGPEELEAEIALEQSLGILSGRSPVTAWAPGR